MKPKYALLGLIILLLLAACSSAASPTVAPEAPYDQSAGEGFGGVLSEPELRSLAPGEALEDTATNSAAADRIVIKNANLSIVVADPESTMTEIVRMAESLGGFVVSSELYQTTNAEGQEFPRARITVRVPADQLNQALEQIKSGAGEVLSENVTGEDVTQQYTDLQSRLRNLEQAEEQLRGIMEDANRTEDVLQVYSELTRVREQIEVIKGQIQYYEQSAALSAIAVDIQAEDALQPLSIAGWEPAGVARDAVQALINALKFFVNAAIWFGLFILPVLVILMLPILAVVYFVRRARRRSKAAKGAEPAESTD
jgi:hypothetical protein